MVICYPQPGKDKSRRILEAFAAGCGGKFGGEGTPAFYGVVGLESIWHAARARRDFIYLDNAFFDCARGTHYRAARNRLQQAGGPDFKRLAGLDVTVQPWRKSGRHVLVVMQSDHFMREVAGWPHGAQNWQATVLRRIKEQTDRPIVVRHWSRDKVERAQALRSDFKDCWMVVTHASAAANEALLDGIPVYVTDQDCAAVPMASRNIEDPYYSEDRAHWVARLAGSQWTLREFVDGVAWRALCALH